MGVRAWPWWQCSLFVSLFAFGGDYFGWTDPAGYVQLSLVSCFVFGIICGIRVKN